MTREQAKIYAELSRKDIENIDKGFAEHYDVICAFANGAEIEYFDFILNEWFSTNNPAFGLHFKYRVKQGSENFPLKCGENYFFLNEYGDIKEEKLTIENFYSTSDLLKIGNCFRTREEAEAALERVRAALKVNERK